MYFVYPLIVAILGYNDGLPHANAGHGVLIKVFNIAIGIVAGLSVLFVAIGGLRFILSEGDPQAASKARATIIYAAVGLLIAMAAESIVAFVLNRKGL